MKPRIFCAEALSHLEPEGSPTGIFKNRLTRAMALTATGLAEDIQADKRFHGGPEKALHLYPSHHYQRLAQAHPDLASSFVPGSLGENLSCDQWDETSACIGDVLALGACRIQISQPRSPCWKINHKFDRPKLSQLIADEGITGWYFRVLSPGIVQPDDDLVLLERNADPVSVIQLWRTHLNHRPPRDELQRIAATPGLNPEWAKKFRDRASWLNQMKDTLTS